MTERELLENIRRSPEAQKLLSVLRFAEGTSGAKNPYAVTFGGGSLSDLSKHPDTVYKNRSAAAGAYQFLPGTWKVQAQRLGLPDFGPRSQDIAALALARNRLKPLGGLAVLEKEGLSPRVLNALAPEWASLPTLSGSSYYGQPVKSRAELERIYAQTSPEAFESAPSTASQAPSRIPRTSFQDTMRDVIKQFGSKIFGSLSSDNVDKTADYLKAAAFSEDPELAAEYHRLALQASGDTGSDNLISSISTLPVALLDAYGAVKAYNSRAEQLERSINPTDVVSSNTPTTGANFVARTGSTGISTGPHLDIRYESGKSITPQELDAYIRIGSKLPSELPLTSPYGPRKAPTAGASTFHQGIDIGVPAGTPIYATGGATLRRSLGDTGAGGYTVEVNIPGKGVARLLHLTPGSSPLSRRGQ